MLHSGPSQRFNRSVAIRVSATYKAVNEEDDRAGVSIAQSRLGFLLPSYGQRIRDTALVSIAQSRLGFLLLVQPGSETKIAACFNRSVAIRVSATLLRRDG